MGMQLKNLHRLTPEQLAQIQAAAQQHRAS